MQLQIERTAEQKELARQQFEQLTEAASTLMDSGDLDVYSQKKVSLLVFSIPGTTLRQGSFPAWLTEGRQALTCHAGRF